jgi:hypothetical protein
MAPTVAEIFGFIEAEQGLITLNVPSKSSRGERAPELAVEA